MVYSTVFLTVLSGVLVFVFGQTFLKLVIDPVCQLKKTRSDISHTLIRYGHVIHNAQSVPEELHTETFDKLRELSGQLYADMELIPAYGLFGRVFFLPGKSKVYAAAKNLTALSNWMP